MIRYSELKILFMFSMVFIQKKWGSSGPSLFQHIVTRHRRREIRIDQRYQSTISDSLWQFGSVYSSIVSMRTQTIYEQF